MVREKDEGKRRMKNKGNTRDKDKERKRMNKGK